MITLDDAKSHLNVTFTDDDTLIQSKIDAASAWIALYTGATFTDPAPAPVQETCRQIVASLYADREAIAQDFSLGMLDSYRVWAF